MTADAVTSADRFARVRDILERHRRDPARLIPILQEVQQEYRYLPREVLTFVATSLGRTPSEVYGVATFYSHFTLQPKGRYVVRICDGTACNVKGSPALLEAVRRRLGVTAEHPTTPDIQFTVETVACLGACGLAPAMVINDDVYGRLTPAMAVDILDALGAKETT